MAQVSIRNVTKSYGSTEIIHGISVDIPDGEFVVVVGPSGCGKSTLLRMVAGLESITGGEISIDDRVVNDLEPMERNIAMVFQNYALYPHMSVFNNMAYGLKNRKMPAPDIKEKVHEVAEILEIETLLQRRPSQLSGGQRQRVAMGRAIVRNPKVFLFDEPLSNLDAKLRVSMRIEIKKLQRELGTTTIYVTHDQVEAMTLADRLIAMNDGVAEQIGAPLDLYHTPRSRFVAGFIGSPPINFLPIDRAGGALRVAGVEIPETSGRDPVSAGVRPEDIHVGDATDAASTADIVLVEPLGAETLLHVTVPGPDGSSTGLIVREPHNTGRSPGEKIGLKFVPDRIVLFDENGIAIAHK